MDTLLTFPLPVWTSIITALGWLYCAFAASWPRLFYRNLLRQSHREEWGYRFGRAIYWQLPRRPAIALAVLSVVPWLALLVGSGPVVQILLIMAVVGFSLLWLIQPPGQRLGLIERQFEGQGLVFELRATHSLLRASLVFLIFGLLPALAIGISVNGWMNGWVRE